jgi:hypothetical protein
MEWWIALVAVLTVVWLLSRRRAQQRLTPMPIAQQLIPHSYDLDNPEHVVRIDEIREAYANLLTHDESEFGNCTFKPASLLPYSRQEIRLWSPRCRLRWYSWKRFSTFHPMRSLESCGRTSSSGCATAAERPRIANEPLRTESGQRQGRMQ